MIQGSCEAHVLCASQILKMELIGLARWCRLKPEVAWHGPLGLAPGSHP